MVLRWWCFSIFKLSNFHPKHPFLKFSCFEPLEPAAARQLVHFRQFLRSVARDGRASRVNGQLLPRLGNCPNFVKFNLNVNSLSNAPCHYNLPQRDGGGNDDHDNQNWHNFGLFTQMNQMAQNGTKGPKVAQMPKTVPMTRNASKPNGPGFAQNGPTCLNGQILPNDPIPEVIQMAQNGLNGPKQPKMAQNFPNGLKCPKSPKCPE